MSFTVRSADWSNDGETLMALRKRVFVLEWRVPEHKEFDEADLDAFHVLIVDDKNSPIATARLTRCGVLGRIAVKQGYRCLAIYRTIFATLIETAKRESVPVVKVACNLDSVPYHQSIGFRPAGQVFMDAGVPRQQMQCGAERFPLPDVTQIH
jgi:predicted GNAT family N-acyltransferase